MRASSVNSAQRGAWSGSASISSWIAHLPDRATRGAAHDREDQVLDQQLAQQPRAAGADGQADAHFAAAGERARQHHRRDVGAGDDQQQRHRRAERRGDGAVVAA